MLWDPRLNPSLESKSRWLRGPFLARPDSKKPANFARGFPDWSCGGGI